MPEEVESRCNVVIPLSRRLTRPRAVVSVLGPHTSRFRKGGSKAAKLPSIAMYRLSSLRRGDLPHKEGSLNARHRVFEHVSCLAAGFALRA